MAKLGEAYVRIRGDLAPLDKDVERGLKQITDKIEKSLNKQFGKSVGKDMGSGIRDGLRDSSVGINAELDKGLNIPANNRRRGRKAGEEFGDGYGDGIFGSVKRISGLFITALEDGFSSLPPQVKGIVGAALVAAIVPTGAFLSAAVAASIIAGTVGIGVALASQFAEVEDKWGSFVIRLRERAVKEAEPFAGQTIASLDLFDEKLDELDPKLSRLFQNASKYVEPFARGIAGAVDGLVSGLDRGFENADFAALSAEIENGLAGIGTQLGDTFEQLLSNPDLDVSLGDLLGTIEDLIDVGGDFLNWTITAYNDLKGVAQIAGTVVDNFFRLAQVITDISNVGGENGFDDLSNSWDHLVEGVTGKGGDQIRLQATRIDHATRDWNDTTYTTIKLTEDQEKALKELNAQIEAQLRLTNDVISTQISYQEAIDQTNESIKENGRTLNLRNKEGRENARNVQNEINTLREQVKAQLEDGKITDEQAQTFYDKEIARIRGRFKGNKELLAQFDSLFGKLTELSDSPPVPNKFSFFSGPLRGIVAALNEILEKQRRIREQGLPSTHNKSGVGPGQQKYADGGFITRPTEALMGENFRPELVLPLTNMRRSMQLLGQSRLAGTLGGGTSVAVYIGNEQLDARMYKVANATNRSSARTLSQTPRMV